MRVGVLDGETVHALVFPCRLRGQLWVDAETVGKSRSLRPTGKIGRRISRELGPQVELRYIKATAGHLALNASQAGATDCSRLGAVLAETETLNATTGTASL